MRQWFTTFTRVSACLAVCQALKSVNVNPVNVKLFFQPLGWRCIKQELDDHSSKLELEHSSKQQTLNGNSHGTTNSNSNGSVVNGVQSGAAAGKIKYISGCTTSSIPSTFFSYTLILTALFLPYLLSIYRKLCSFWFGIFLGSANLPKFAAVLLNMALKSP